jgi:hypothetical protein
MMSSFSLKVGNWYTGQRYKVKIARSPPVLRGKDRVIKDQWWVSKNAAAAGIAGVLLNIGGLGFFTVFWLSGSGQRIVEGRVV